MICTLQAFNSSLELFHELLDDWIVDGQTGCTAVLFADVEVP